MNTRLRRADRLLELAERGVDGAQGRLSEARRVVHETRARKARAEAAWSAAADGFTCRLSTAGDIERHADHLRTLRLRIEACATELVKAEDAARRCVGDLLRANTERRKLELWRGRLGASEAEGQVRAERRVADEQAARTVGRRT